MPIPRRRPVGPVGIATSLVLGLLVATTQAQAQEPSGGAGGETRLVKDILPGQESGLSHGSIVLGSSMIFAADDGVHGEELWISDGTSSGTRLVKDITPGASDSVPSNFIELDGRILFTTEGAAVPSGSEIWVTDGTAAGTRQVTDIGPGSADSNPSSLTVIGDTVWFNAFTSSADGSGVWTTDGTTEGTRPVKLGGVERFSGSAFERITEDRVVFRGFDEQHGSELWVSDGTAGGTRLLKDVNPGRGDAISAGPSVVGGRAVFAATTTGPIGDYELWSTDGTAAGTAPLKDIAPGPTSSNPFEFTPLGSSVVFSATSPELGRELWTTDGTTEGTRLLRDINPGAARSAPNGFVEFQGRLYFAVDTAEAEELWATAGTPASTVAVKRLRTRDPDDPGQPGSLYGGDSPGALRAGADRLYFAAFGMPGGTFWSTDGTESGTVQIADPPQGRLAQAKQPVGGTMLFAADGPPYGQELWAHDPQGFNRATARPTVSGDRIVGRRLVATPGRYTEPSTFQYQWLRDGTPLGDATASSYVLRPADAGRRISVRVTARAPAHEPVVSVSSEGTPIQFTSTTAVTSRRSGRTVTFSIEVRSAAPGATRGAVRVKDGSRMLTTRTLTDGRVRVVLHQQAKRRHVYRISFRGSTTVAGSSTTRTITVR